jgi:hypothetical protein
MLRFGSFDPGSLPLSVLDSPTPLQCAAADADAAVDGRRSSPPVALPPPPPGSLPPSPPPPSPPQHECLSCISAAARVEALTKALTMLAAEKQSVVDGIVSSSSEQLHTMRVERATLQAELHAENARHEVELSSLRGDLTRKVRALEDEVAALKMAHEQAMAKQAADHERALRDYQKRASASQVSDAERLKKQVKTLTIELTNEKELSSELSKKLTASTSRVGERDVLTKEVMAMQKKKEKAEVSALLLAQELYDMLATPPALEATRWWLEHNMSKLYSASMDMSCGMDVFTMEAMNFLSNWRNGQLDKLVDKNVRLRMNGIRELAQREQDQHKKNSPTSIINSLKDGHLAIHIYDTPCANPAHAAYVANQLASSIE